MMTGGSGSSLCDTCSNCECVFQSGVVREQCDFYIEKVEEIDFVAEHRKADMAKVNTIRVNGKKYVSIDRVLEIIDKLDNENMGLPDWSDDYEVACNDFRAEVETLKDGEQV